MKHNNWDQNWNFEQKKRWVLKNKDKTHKRVGLKRKIKKESRIPERSVGEERNVQAHEENRGQREDSLTKPQSQAGTSAKCPWQLVHAIAWELQLTIVDSIYQRF